MSRALLVEDNSLFSESFKHSLLHQFPDLEIAVATNETTARNLIEIFSPDLIFLDVHLTDGSCLDLTREVKLSSTNAIIVMLANYDIQEYKTMAHNNGADFFLSKERPLKDIINFIAEIIVLSLLRPKLIAKTIFLQ
jgi:two-component system response regulator YesN